MRSKRWDPADDDLSGLLFEGAPALLRQLDDLVLRPRHWWRKTQIPIIYLVGETPKGNPLDVLADRLREARRVPHSRINEQEDPSADNGQLSANSIRRLLDRVVADLSQRSGRGRRLRFPHYRLAVWLASLIMNHTIPPDQNRRIDDELQRFIKEHFWPQNRTIRTEIPWWIGIPALLLKPLGTRLMLIFWHPSRWIAESKIASKLNSRSLRGLARKSMDQGPGGYRHGIRQDEIDRLLVDAFMEDLRRGYRCTTLFGVGPRRMIYPVLLIGKIGSTTAGFHLLKLVSGSRTDYLHRNIAGPGRRQPRERNYFHPLLIIAQGDSSVLDEMGFSNYPPEDQESYSIAEIKYYYNKWQEGLTNLDCTWLIPLRVPNGRRRPLRTELTDIRLPAAPPPVMTFVTITLLITAVSFTGYSTYYMHCGAWYWEPQLHRQVLTPDRDQCVGLSSSDHRFFDDVGDVSGMDPELVSNLKEIEDLIHRTNELAVENSNYLTVVYLSQLTSRDVASYRWELEQLRGIAVAQKKSLEDRPVRVLLANGGDGMDHGKAAAEAIAREASEDATLVAAVGLGISRTGTRDAIMRLARPDTHIPTIGTAISATDLATKTSPYYHQIGPTNQREAEVAAFYAKTRLGAQKVTIYYSGDKDDLYSNDLRGQAKRAFEAHGLEVREKQYKVNPGDYGGDINLIGQDACGAGPDGVAFYAGRGSKLPAFLAGMRDKCGPKRYPHFLGGDTVSRFVLDEGLKNFPELDIDYLAQASSLAWKSGCNGTPNSVSFFVAYRELFGEAACLSTRSGGSLLAYDTLLVFIRGVRNTGVSRPSPDAVLAGIEAINSSREGLGSLGGVSGQIDYPHTGDQDQTIPKDKSILVLRGRSSGELKRMLLCGQHDTAQPPPDNCSAPLGP